MICCALLDDEVDSNPSADDAKEKAVSTPGITVNIADILHSPIGGHPYAYWDTRLTHDSRST